MITAEMIARINELARKKKESGLTPDELSEQGILRQQYIDSIKSQVKQHLDNITVVDEEPCICGCQGHKHHHH